MKISVCLAAYNGQRYIASQISSILEQLGADDELIIGDDCSTDNTISIIESFSDKRIVVLKSDKNLRHVKNFERIISKAKGQLIFLSDQDDIWERGKLIAMIEIFDRYPSVTMVHHALSLMNERGDVYERHWNHLPDGISSKRRFLIRQIFKSQIFGCGLAFRASMLKYMLPFPRGVYAHDHWISLVNGIHGQIYHLNSPLVRYRQHANNLTPKKGLAIHKQLKVRCLQLTHVVEIMRRG